MREPPSSNSLFPLVSIVGRRRCVRLAASHDNVPQRHLKAAKAKVIRAMMPRISANKLVDKDKN